MALFVCIIGMLIANQDEELPKPTPEGTKALQALVKRCVEAGPSKFSPQTEAGPGRLVVADSARRSTGSCRNRSQISQPLRDTLLTTSRSVDQSVLARSRGEAGKRPATASSRPSRGRNHLPRKGTPPTLPSDFREAVRQFESLRFSGWQAMAEGALASLLEAQGRFDEAHEHHAKVIQVVDRTQGKASRDAAIARINLGAMEQKAGQPAAALHRFRDALGILEALPDANPADMLSGTETSAACSWRAIPKRAWPIWKPHRSGLEAARRR